MHASGLNAVVDWSRVWPDAPEATKRRLLQLTQTWERLQVNPAMVTLEENLDAACELARVAEVLVTTKKSAVELWFSHDGQECNCVYFELYYRVVYVAERFLWRVHRDDRGGLYRSRASAAVSAERRAARTLLTRRLMGLLSHTHSRLTHAWRDVPAACKCSRGYLAHLMAAVRSYGLWNAAARRHALLVSAVRHDAVATPLVSLPSVDLESMDTVVNLLVEALRGLDELPADWKVADGAFPFVRANVPKADDFKACNAPRDAKPNALPVAHLVAQTWSEALLHTLLAAWAHLSHAMGELGRAVALGRVLEARGETVAWLDQCERINRTVQQRALDTPAAIEAALMALPGVPDSLRVGESPLVAGSQLDVTPPAYERASAQ